MKTLLAKYHTFRMDIEGATAIEYGLIAGGISLAIAAVVFTFGTDLKTLFTTMGTSMTAANAKVTTG